MVSIAVVDGNAVFCQGLKIMLEQVDGFSISIVDCECITDNSEVNSGIDVLLIDEDLYTRFEKELYRVQSLYPSMKILLMTMDCPTPPIIPGELEKICKGSGKGIFSEKINQIVHRESNP